MSNVDSGKPRPPGLRRMGELGQAAPGVSGRRVLNTGSGPLAGSRLHGIFANGWSQVRLDIDAGVQPDLVGTIRDMRSLVPNASFDAIWASHNLEHLHAHEVPAALGEFRRVLKDDGFALITCPDLEAIAAQLLEKGASKPVYMSPAGPITALDMFYGHGRSIAGGNRFMCHNTGFTVDSLGQAALGAGFVEARVGQGSAYDLWALLMMPKAEPQFVASLFAPTAERFLFA